MAAFLSTQGGRFRVTLLAALVLLGLLAGACSGSASDTPDGDLDPDGDTSDGDIDPNGDIDPDGDEDGDIDGDEDGDIDGDEDGDIDGDEDGDIDGDEEQADPAVVTVEPGFVDFGLVDILTQAGKPVLITNESPDDGQSATINGIELTRSSSPAFSLACENTPFVLDPGLSSACDAFCQPASPGEHHGTMRIYGVSDDGLPFDLRVSLRCGTVLPIAYADPAHVAFGFVDPDGPPKTRFVTIGNAGSIELEIHALSLSQDEGGPFEILGDPEDWEGLVLDPSEGFLVELRHRPTNTEQALAWLEIETSDPQLPVRRVRLSARGVADCPEGFALEEDACVSVCLPDSVVCTGNRMGFRLCSETGESLSDPEACPSGQRCVDGACIWALCVEGESFCRGGAPVQCVGDLASEQLAPPCADDPDCPNVCVPGGFCAYPEINHYCDDEDACTDGICTHGLGCDFVFNNEPCEDDNACTTATRCVRGVCTGQPVLCNDDNPCTANSCDPDLGCVSTPVEGPCNDMDACTVNDRCQDGVCIGDERVCDDGNACTLNTCDPVAGCVFITSGLPCDDGNPCTHQDTCVNFACRGVPFDPNDGVFCNGPEVCDPSRPAGEAILSPSPVICNDGVACTVDICNEAMKRCDHIPDHSRCDDGNPCTVGTCDPLEGCIQTPRPNNTNCDITPGVVEKCFHGQCVSRCTSDADCQDGLGCTIDTCDFNVDPGFGWCHHQPVDALCDDGIFCNGLERCDLQLGCVAGTPVNCSDTHLCTFDYCDEEQRRCVHQPRDWMCEDYNPCTLNICQPSKGCVYLPTQGSCNDGDPCTLGDFCLSGVCQPGPRQLDCDDANPCTTSSCEPGLGCLHVYNQNPCEIGDACYPDGVCESGSCVGTPLDCDDGIFCNGVETCGPFGCEPGEPVVCDDGIPCTIGHCDERERGCVFELDHSLCADNNPCTVNEVCTYSGCEADVLEDGTSCDMGAGSGYTCQEGFCVAPCTDDEDCDDEIPCTLDFCDTERGYCRHTPRDIMCSDGLWCTGEEVCDRIEGCLSGEEVDCDDGIACTFGVCDDTEQTCIQTADNSLCDDGNVCTLGICNLETGCIQAPVSGDCDDGNPCTLNTRCQGGQCVGVPNSCDDGNPCTIGSCNPDTGCAQRPVQDGLSCGSGGEDRVCLDGDCLPGCTSDASCDDGNPCTVDTCDPRTFECHHQPLDALCDDGIFCNGVETCDIELGCLPGTPVDCDDDNPCTQNICDEFQGRCRNPLDASICDDGNPCTNNICTPTGCEWVNNTRPCDDGDICTIGDTCTGGACVGSQRTCDDGNRCTTGSCDPFFGCLYEPVVCPDSPECRLSFCDPNQGCIMVDRFESCDAGDPCTAHDRCNGGVCEPGHAISCDDHNSCTVDSCGPQGCEHSPLPDETPCLLIYGEAGKCLAGECVRTCTNDYHCLDGAACSTGVCNLETGICDFTFDHGMCDDGVFCNGEERCEPFIGCVPGTPVDCNDGLACTVDYCDEDQQRCVNDPVDARCEDNNPCTVTSCDPVQGCVVMNNDGAACDDDNPCTVNTQCLGGACVGEPRDCDDGNPCTGPDTCDPRKGCRNPPTNEGTACGEGGICTGGFCAEPCMMDSDCDDGVSCTMNICNPLTGRCTSVPDDGACSDGRWCNGQEWCHPTFDCQPGRRVNCDDGIACTTDFCSDSLRRCVHTPVHGLCNDGNSCTVNSCDPTQGCVFDFADGLSCHIDDACSEGGICQAGICSTLGDIVCTGPACNRIYCDRRLGCQNMPLDGRTCDKDACSLYSRCIAGECVATVPRDCIDTNPCTENTCDPVGGCQSNPRHGAPCDDLNRCTINTQCNMSVCQGAARDCDDGNPCTESGCDPATGCTYTPANELGACLDHLGEPGICVGGVCAGLCSEEGQPCDDMNACTHTESCSDGLCVGLPQDCDDGNPCTENGCDPATGCTALNLADQTPCQTAGGKTGVCILGVCESFCDTDSDCDDGNPCTANTCTPSGCATVSRADGTVCDDGDPCTLDDRCSGGRCVSMFHVQCVSGDPCMAGSCDESGECVFEPVADGLSCDDGDPCTFQNTCQGGVCAGVALDCDDGNPCTVTFCDEGACHIRRLTGPSCDDGNPCTLASMCMDGICRGLMTDSCDDANPCTFDTCTPQGCQHTPISGRSCDDGDPCTVGDVCREGVCMPGVGELVCEDDNPCTVGLCVSGVGCEWEALANGSPCSLTSGVDEVCMDGLCVELF